MTWDQGGWRRKRQAVDESVADECEAFLTGTYWEYITARKRPCPVWAYINRVAHTAPDDVISLADTPERIAEPVLDWLDVERAVADQLVAMTGGDLDAIRRLQRRVLLPLELAIASEPEADAKLGARHLVALTRAALEGHPSASGG